MHIARSDLFHRRVRIIRRTFTPDFASQSLQLAQFARKTDPSITLEPRFLEVHVGEIFCALRLG